MEKISCFNRCRYTLRNILHFGKRGRYAHEIGRRAIYRAVAEANVALFDTIYDRYIDLHVKSVQERYNELIDKYKDIFSYFSLKRHRFIP